MFSKNILYVEIFSLELCQKTEKWVESLRQKNDENFGQLLQERREISDCGIRLLQCIDNSFTGQIVTKFKSISFTEHPGKSEEKEESSAPLSSDREEASTLSPPSFPNVFSDSGIDVTQEDNENTLLTMNGLAAGHNNCEPLESINALRDVLRQLKKATDKAVVRFLVRSREVLREEIKSQNDIDRDEKLLGLISDLLRNKHEAEKQLKDLSSSEDGGSPLSALEKSLCYVLVDKALLNCLLILDKALMDGKLTDSELSLQFSTVPSGQKLVSEFSQALNEKRQFIELSDELRRREILVDKMRTQIRELSSEKMGLENENKSFEEKSRLWQLKSEDEEMRNSVIDSDRKRLKEKVLFLEESMSGLQSSTEHLRQQLQTLEHNDDASRQENEVLKEKLQNYSDEMKRDVQNATHLSSTTSSGNSKNMAAKIDSLLKENEELRNKITALETEDYELREKSISVTYAHKQAIQQKIEEIRLVEEQNRTLGEDLDTRLTEILLLKAHVVELQESISQRDLKNLQDQVGSTHDNTDGVWFQKLSHRAETSEHRVEEYAILLEELAKRKGILVSKLEMVGAVTVIKNDCDVPDGYTEAIDGVLRSQTTLIEKGVLSMLSEREEKANERRLLEEENRRLRFTTEALETENLLLQVQVSDLTQTVEELEDDVFYMKCGGKPGKGKRPQTPGSSSGHRVTFDDNTEDKDKKEDEKLESLIQNAKERCKNLEKQVRSNTSLLKTTQHRNQTLLKDHEDLRRENCNLRQYLEECQRTKKILHIKITELEESLQSVDDGKSLDEMEKQSLIDRLKIFEGQIKSLKLERETMRSRVESLKAGSDNTQSLPYSKFLFLEEANHDALLKKNGLVDEVERLKNKIKKQSARSRILKSEVFEFLDDIRCLETELGSVVDGFDSTEQTLEADGGECKEGTTPSESEANKIGESECETITEVNTWGVEASLCQQHGMTPVMIEIIELLKSTTNRLQRISRNSSLASVSSVDSIDGERHNSSHGLSDLRKQLSTEISELRNEKQILQREVFVLKAISENTLEVQPHSPEDVFETNEKDRTRYLRKQVLDSVQRNSELEGEILDYLTQKWALESELDNLKERILNLKNERDTLLSLGEVARLPCAGHNWGKSHEKSMRHFCFVKNRENEFEVHDVLRIEPDIDNEDVFSCPSDECVCHSPDREASSCDSGYHSCRYEEGHRVAFNDKGDNGPHSRHLIPHTSTRPLNVSYYDNTRGAERHVSDPLSMTTTEKKPKGILKKRNYEQGGLSTQILSVESG